MRNPAPNGLNVCGTQVYSCGVHATNPTGLHLQETLGTVFGQFARLIGRRQALDPHAMSRTDYALLATLEHCSAEAGLRISTLAATQGHDASTISRRVTQLERHGLLERLADPSDGRASTVRLTPRGEGALSEERAARTGMLRPVLADWPEQDLAALDRLLTRLSADMAAGDPPSSLSSSPERSPA